MGQKERMKELQYHDVSTYLRAWYKGKKNDSPIELGDWPRTGYRFSLPARGESRCKVVMEEDDVVHVVSNDESNDCCCIYYYAVTIIQKLYRGWSKHYSYVELMAYWAANLEDINRRLVAEFMLALRLKRRRRAKRNCRCIHYYAVTIIQKNYRG